MIYHALFCNSLVAGSYYGPGPDSAKKLCYNAAIDNRPAGPMSGQPGDIRKDRDES